MFINIFSHLSGHHGSSFARPEENTGHLSKATTKMKKAVMKSIVAGAFAGFTLALAVKVSRNALSGQFNKPRSEDKGERKTALKGDTYTKRCIGEVDITAWKDDGVENDKGGVEDGVKRVMASDVPSGEHVQELAVDKEHAHGIEYASPKEEVVAVDPAQDEAKVVVALDNEGGLYPTLVKNTQQLEVHDNEANNDKNNFPALTRRIIILQAMIRTRDQTIADMTHSRTAERALTDEHTAHLAKANGDLVKMNQKLEQERDDARQEVVIWRAESHKAWNETLVVREERDAAREERDLALDKLKELQLLKTAPIAVVVVEDIENTFVEEEVVEDKDQITGDVKGQGTPNPKSMDELPNAPISDPTATAQEPILRELIIATPAQDIGEAAPTPSTGHAEGPEDTTETPTTDGDVPSKPKRHRKRHHKRANKDRLPAPIPMNAELPSDSQVQPNPIQPHPKQVPLPPRFQVAGALHSTQRPAPFGYFGRTIIPSLRQPMGAFRFVKQRREQREIIQGDSQPGC